MESHVPGIETADYEVVEVSHDVESLTELFAGASVVLQHGRPVQHATAPRSSRPASPPARTTSTPPASRTGYHLRREVRRGLRRRRAAAVARHRADVHDRRDRRRARAWRRPAWTPSTSRCSGAAARPSPRPRRSCSTRRCAGAHYLEQNAYVPCDPEAGHYQLAIPGQHELALALPWGGTSHPVWYRKRPARRERQGARRRLQQGADDRRAADRRRRPSRRPRTWRRRAVRRARPRPPRR